jgi:hypothetical protein
MVSYRRSTPTSSLSLALHGPEKFQRHPIDVDSERDTAVCTASAHPLRSFPVNKYEVFYEPTESNLVRLWVELILSKKKASVWYHTYLLRF